MITVAGAAATLRAGGAVVIPTDTVYGLAASPSVPGAVDRLFSLKGRQRAKALPVLGADSTSLASVARFDVSSERIAAKFWPGALTLVLARARGFSADLGGDGSTVAVRVPDHPVALELLRLTGPLAVTSANLSGRPPLTTAEAARGVFGHEVPVLDGGTCDGSASTIVDVTDASVARVGDVDPELVLQVLRS